MTKYYRLIFLLLVLHCGKNYNFNTIHFHDGTTNIMESDSSLLYENLDILIENIDIDVMLEGYTNTVGGDSANLVLSQARADTIKSWLISNEIDANRVATVGYGENDPVADNRTSSGRALNDRVEFRDR
jgi:OOP family OmpA-OmpF porin